jgi:hypothetical protein
MTAKTSAAALAFALLAAPVRAEIPSWCQYSLADMPKGAPRFEDYRVPAETFARAPRADFHGDATALKFSWAFRRQPTTDGTYRGNFAGRFMLGDWTCDEDIRCLHWGMIELQTGWVTIDRTIFSLVPDHIDGFHGMEDDRIAKRLHATHIGVLLFRADSRLLVTLGTPNGDETRNGMTYYEWTGYAFERIAFYPAMKLCKKPKT